MKASFLLHKDSLAILPKMSDEQAGQFIKALYHFQLSGELPQVDVMMEMLLTPFVNQFQRDEVAYQKTVERNRKNGEKGGRPAIEKKKPKKPSGLSGLNKKPTETQENPKNPVAPDKDSDKDKDSDNDFKEQPSGVPPVGVDNEEISQEVRPPSVYRQCMGLYFDFFKKKNEGEPPKIEKKHGAALHSILGHLQTSVKAKNQNLPPPDVDVKTVESFKIVLDDWEKLSDFSKQQVDLCSMNSQWNRITTDLKATRKNGTAQQPYSPGPKPNKSAGANRLIDDLQAELRANAG